MRLFEKKDSRRLEVFWRVVDRRPHYQMSADGVVAYNCAKARRLNDEELLDMDVEYHSAVQFLDDEDARKEKASIYREAAKKKRGFAHSEQELIQMRQTAWERGKTVVRMRNVGMTFSQIGNRLGVNVERTRQIHRKAQLQKTSPMQLYLSRPSVFSCRERDLMRHALPFLLGDVSKRDWLIL